MHEAAGKLAVLPVVEGKVTSCVMLEASGVLPPHCLKLVQVGEDRALQDIRGHSARLHALQHVHDVNAEEQ